MMIYFIDGYNLLFYLFKEEKISLLDSREYIIQWISKNHSSHITSHIVFDGQKNQDEIFSFKHGKIIYTKKNYSADDYILDQIESGFFKQTTIVTSDKGLAKFGKSLGAETVTIEEFTAMNRRKAKKEVYEKMQFDSEKEILRLEKIFLKKLKNQN